MASNDKQLESGDRCLSSEVGFIVFQGPNCGYVACGRENPHYHCAYCGFGTSQSNTTLSHKKSCPVKDESGPGDFVNITETSDITGLLHESIIRPPQAYPYYSTLSQTTVTMSLPSTQATNKTSQQNTMFNFVLPGQNSQYSGIYGSQNVFPNPNLFSPSNYNYNQLDSWVTKPTGLNSSGSIIQNDNSRSHYDKFEQTCTSYVNSTTVGLCSPLTAEAYKVVSKELNSLANKVDSQNWFCNPSIMNYTLPVSQQSSCKYSDPCHSVPQVSFVLFEQSDQRLTDENLNPDNICFNNLQPSHNEIGTVDRKNDELKLNKTYLPESDVKYEFSSSCMQGKVNQNCEKDSDKNMKIVEERNKNRENDLDETSSSDESDIIVEESNEELGELSQDSTCLLCHKKQNFKFEFVNVKNDFPLTTTSHVPVVNKLSQVVECNFPNTKIYKICKKCLNVVNTLDCLEIKLQSVKKQMVDLFGGQKEETVEKIVPKSNENDENWKCLCKVCGKIFSTIYYLEKHMQSHTKSYSYYCEHCGKGFAVLNKLDHHILLHLKKSKYQCEKCGKQFLQHYNLVVHLKKHSGEVRYKCSFCEKGFLSRAHIETHERIHLNDKPFVCQFCGKQFNVIGNLKTHVQCCSNNYQFTCDKCDKKFVLKSLLKKHIALKHELTFKIVCEVCLKGFMKKSDLKKHMKSHSNEKRFKCEICKNCYKTVSSLNHHRKMHSSRATTGVVCKICKKVFSSKTILEDHVNCHTGSKPYECTICNKSFSNRVRFYVHNKRHERDYKGTSCPICHQVFDYGVRKEHLQTHEGVKPFSCEKCGCLFTAKSSLKKHMNLKHKVCTR